MVVLAMGNESSLLLVMRLPAKCLSSHGFLPNKALETVSGTAKGTSASEICRVVMQRRGQRSDACLSYCGVGGFNGVSGGSISVGRMTHSVPVWFRLRRRWRGVKDAVVTGSRVTGKLLTSSPRDFVQLTRAQAYLFRAYWLVSTRPTGALVDPASAPQVSVASDRMERAQEIGRLVRRAAFYGIFRPKCLVRAVAIDRMLKAEGIEGSRIHVGVRMNPTFLAHAWVELGNTIVGDRKENIETFTQLTDLSLFAES